MIGILLGDGGGCGCSCDPLLVVGWQAVMCGGVMGLLSDCLSVWWGSISEGVALY